MARIAVYLERYTIARSEEMGAILRFGQVSQRLGHRFDILFRPDMYKIPDYDALFIRALTDPLNSSYVAARTAEVHGLRVIDDPTSIRICCDKVSMYGHLMKAGVAAPTTEILSASDLTLERGAELLERLGSPLVLKAPNSSFSMYVEKASTPEEVLRVGRRFLRRADRLVAQRFVRSSFDWRVGVLGGEVLYVCQYTIPRKQWKIMTWVGKGRVVAGPVKAFDVGSVDPRLLETARAAAAAVGTGLYGIDLKEVDGEYVVIEVNDNPTLAEGEEDRKAPDLYERVIRYLAREWG